MTTFISSLAFKLIAIGAVVLILLFAVSQCTGQRKAAEQANQDARSSGATAETAQDAMVTAINRLGDDAEVDTLVRETARQIDTLPPQEAAKVARKAICSLPEYAKDAQCTR